MKKFIFALLFLSLVTSCKLFEKYQEPFFELVKAFSKQKLQKLFPEADFSSDTLSLTKDFKKVDLQKVLGKKITDFFTTTGELYLETQEFKARIYWVESIENPDCVTLHLIYYKKLDEES